MKPQWFIVSALLLFSSGCIDSKTPLSDAQNSKLDKRLAGVWRLSNKDQVTYYHIGPTTEKFPEGVMRAVAVTHHKGKLGSPGELLLFPTVLGDKTYLNVIVVTEEQVKLIEKKGLGIADAYLIFKYDVDGNQLLVRCMDADARKRAIESGKVQGVVKENNSTFTDTIANLARFVAEAGDGLFANGPIKLEKMNIAEK